MKRLRQAVLRVGLAASLPMLTSNLYSQRTHDEPSRPLSPALTTTRERVETEPWWPGKSSFPLAAFAGSNACARCHAPESASQPSSMRRAASLAGDAAFPSGTDPLTLSMPPLSYALASTAGGIRYTASNGTHKVSQQLDWVMGAGDLGRTFLYQREGRWYQSEISFYTAPASLDLTTGLGAATGPSLTAALGQPLSPEDARSCFGCHTVHATTPAGLNPLHAEAGVGCEACHGPGRTHAQAEGNPAGSRQATGPPGSASVFNPASLSPADSIDFCGSCHRSFADAMLSTGSGASTAVVRFQPYRLEESRCWRATQSERLTCVACHNPHAPLNRNLISYDKYCLQCHTGSGVSAEATHAAKTCPKATGQCVSCHMPRVAVASMHGEFTDHLIRVVHPRDELPK